MRAKSSKRAMIVKPLKSPAVPPKWETLSIQLALIPFVILSNEKVPKRILTKWRLGSCSSSVIKTRLIDLFVAVSKLYIRLD